MESEIASKYTCPICCGVYDQPVTTPCNHTFCEKCFADSQHRNKLCPICRLDLSSTHCSTNVELEREISATKVRCIHCRHKVLLQDFNSHTQSCGHPQSTATSSASALSKIPNRSTFACPICYLPNLDCSGLLEHCNEHHSTSCAQVVCPVCASMPWGDPNKLSTNFVQHLNLRHKFEYDTFVDYEQDEEDALMAAIEASLANC